MAGRLHIDDWTRHPHLPAFKARARPVFGPNLAPRRWLSILRHAEGELVLDEAFWGLTPSWLQVLDHAPHCARAESLETRPMFREALASRRCVLPVSGIFVWLASLCGKQPYLVVDAERAPLMLAALWSRYTDDDTPVDKSTPPQTRDSFALITVPASEAMAPLTDRLPAIITPASLDAWLAVDTSMAQVRDTLAPAPRELLGAFPVSRRMNDPAQQDWACAYPVGPLKVWQP